MLAALRADIVSDRARGPFGGAPAAVRPDWGRELTADALRRPCAAQGSTSSRPRPTPRNAMGVVHEPAEMGKTYAVESALAARRRPGRWASFPSRPTVRLVAAALYERLTGSPASRGHSRFVLMDAVIEELSTRPRTVVIDEAQRLNTECRPSRSRTPAGTTCTSSDT